MSLPENPVDEVWYYCKYLPVKHIAQYARLILLIKLPAVDNDTIQRL